MKLSVPRQVHIRDQREQAALQGQVSQKLRMITRQVEVSLTSVPQHLTKVSRVGPVGVISCNQESQSLVKFLVMRQVKDQAGKLNEQVRDMIRSKDSDLGQTVSVSLDKSTEVTGQARKSDHRSGLGFGLMGYLARYRHRYGCSPLQCSLSKNQQ